MKLKRFMAIVISLAMVLSIVPAFNLTASASVTTNGMLPTGAVKVFDGGAGGKSIVGTPSGDTYVQNVWGSTWSSNWTGGGEGSNAINIITSNDRGQTQYALQTYDKAGITSYAKTTAGYGSESDWFAFEYISTAGDVTKDVAILGYNPSTSTEVVIDQYRSGNSGFDPAGSSYFATTGTLTSSEGMSSTGYVDWGIYRIFVEKGDGEYTVSYYHSTFANRDVSFTHIGTKTYSGDLSGVGFGGVQIYNQASGAWWNNMRFWEPVVWADGVAEGNQAVAVNMKSYSQTGGVIVSGTISVAGKSNYLQRVDGTTYGGGTPSEIGSARYAQLKFDVPNLDIKKVTLKTKVVRVHNYLGTGQWMKLGVYSGAVTPSGTNTSYKLSEEKVYGAGNANTVYNSIIHTDVTDYITANAENTLTISVPYSAFSIESTPQLIVEYTPAATTKSVTVNYTADGKIVKTVDGIYDTTSETGLALDAYTYYANGGNYIYTAAATTMAESGTIVMTPSTNNGPYTIGDTVTYSGKKYQITGTNLIPNGDFSQGTLGWFNGTGAAASFFTSNGDGTMTLSSGGTGQGGASSLYRAWKVEPGTTYVYTYTSTGGGQYHKNSLGASFGATAGDGSNQWTGVANTDNVKVFTAGENENYLIVSYRWLGSGEKFGNYGLYEVEEVIETTADTVKAGMDSISLPLATKTSITVPTTSTDPYGYESTISWTSSNADVLAANGTVTAPSDITVVTLTPSTTYNGNTVTGDAHTVYVFPGSVAGTEYNSGSGYYDIGTTNIISAQGTNASFEGQALTGWLAHTGQETNGAMNWVDATVDVVPDGDWAYAGWWNDSITGSNYCTIDTMWEVEAGTYYLSFYAKKPAGGSTTYVYYSKDNAHHTAVDQLTSEAWYELVNPTSEWVKYQYIITADEAGYIGFTSYNIGNNGSRGTMFDDFELYTAVQAAEDLVSVTNPEDITVIAGNQPVLPKTVTGVGERGSAMTVDVTWNSADFTNTTTSAKTVTVTGTAAGMSVSMNVIVLPETFAMDDVVAYAGQNTAAIHYFPIPVTGTATFEFDVVFNKLVNSTITLGDAAGNNGNCPIFGGTGDAISIQTNANGVNIRSWTNGSADRNVTTPVVTGETYRFLIVTDIDSDTWSAIMTDKNGVQTVVADGHGYRKVVDQIDSITVLDNNSSADTINVSNIKVYAPAQASALTTYTVVVNGSVSDTYTVKTTSVDKLAIPYYPGNILKDRSVSGTTVTFTYEATETSLGSWAIRNNVTNNTWISEMKYLGTHNSFANKDTAVKNEGGALRNTADSLFQTTVPGASSTDSATISGSKTQTLDALEQLNAGVRYFDIRLTRQEDGTFWTFHGPAFCDFRPIAYTIGQWAKENPGEVIILDFHQAWDAQYTTVVDNTTYNGDTVGDDNQDFYTALEQLLVDAGIMDLVPGNFDQRYGAMTGNGSKTAILTVAKARGANCVGKFQNRDSWTSGDTTYSDSSTYSTIVSTIETAISNGAFGSGAKFGIIHAYTTPLTGLVSAANTNRSKWINEDLDTWMASGYGDILLMNNVTEADITTYLARLSEYNRDYMDDQLGSEFHGETALTSGDVTMTGATGSVPFSTEFVATSSAASGTYTIDGVDYTAHTAYELALMQFDSDSVQPTGTVNVTFPKVSTDTTTVDVLLSADGTTVYQTAEIGEAISIDTTALADVILATKVAPSVNVTVNYTMDGTTVYSETKSVVIGQEVYNVAASDRAYVKLGDKAYIASSTAQSHVAVAADEGTTKTVSYTLIEDNAVLEDMLVDPDNNIWGINSTDDNSIFVATNGNERCGARTDDDGNATSSAAADVLGNARNGYLQFPVVDLADGQAAVANFYVRSWHGYTFNHGNTWIKLSATAINDDSWTTMSNGATYTDTAAPQFTGYTKTMFSNATTNNVGYIQIDVTDMMKAAEKAGLSTITMRLAIPYGAAYIAEREACVAGGAYEGNASYIDVVEGYTLNVSGATQVTKMGTVVDDMTNIVVPAGETIKIYNETEGVVAYTDGTQVYAVNTIVTPEASGNLAPAVLGVAPVNGAQVRIGDGVDANGKVTAESGLRFITTVNYTDSLAGVANAEMGVEITAEGSSVAAVDIPAKLWQSEDVFTSALTNLAEGNFNRMFTATPYVTADGQTFYGTPVTRSIYQVAAGLLVNNKTADGDSEGYDDAALAEGGRLYKVLNAYVNQTGVRLQINSDKTGLEIYNKDGSTSNYSGDAFFEVVETSAVNNVYTITIKPAGSKTTINSYWQEYIRINNNNSKIAAFTSLVENEDGSVTITFDYASYLAQ